MDAEGLSAIRSLLSKTGAAAPYSDMASSPSAASGRRHVGVQTL
jgi:hypothetical protein